MSDNKNNNEDLKESMRQRSKMNKYSKLARTSMLAITMGVNLAHPAAASEAHSTGQPVHNASIAPTQYTGNSLAYFKNEFLPQSNFNPMTSGESDPTAPTASNVRISGTIKVGKTLTGAYDFNDINDDDDIGSTFEWYRSDDSAQSVNYVKITGATDKTYTLTNDDKGKYITFVVTPKTDAEPMTGTPAKSIATSKVAAKSTSQQQPTETTPPEENPLLEVVALSKDEQTKNSASLTMTKDKDNNATASFHFLSEGVIESSEGASKKETIAVRAKTITGAKTVNADIAGDAIAKLKSNEQRLAVLTGDVAIEFPTKSIPIERLAASKGLTPDQIKLEIKIEKQPDTVKQAAADWAAKQNATVIGQPFKFSMQVNDGTTVTPLPQYGSRYAKFTVPIPEGVTDVNLLGAAILVDGKYMPAPVRIDDAGHAVIHAPSNATVVLIQRNESFPDSEKHWAAADIHLMADKGNASGDAQGNFSPNTPMTRGQFADLLVNAFGLGHQETGASTPQFTDLPADEKTQESIRIATANGLFNGVADGRFAPDQEVSREQMIAVLMRFYNLFELQDEAKTPAGTADLSAYKDTGTISDWAEKVVQAANEAGILTGYENETIRPHRAGSRAEAVALIRRFMQQTNLIN